jgi:biopolymer transport protein ExbD
MTFGRLPRKSSAPPMSEINMTPLIDVMLVLVVIFMMAAPLLSSRLSINLPQAQSAKPAAVPEVLSVAIDSAGRLYLNDQAQTLTALTEVLRAKAQTLPETEVQLRADRVVPYGQVLSLMGTIQQAGLSRVGLVAQP